VPFLVAWPTRLHFKQEKPVRRRTLADAIARLQVEVRVYSHSWCRHEEPVRQQCMAQLVGDLLDLRAHRLVIDSRSNKDVHDKRTLRHLLGPHPSASCLAYEHVDSAAESLLWIADAAAWCYGAGREWRKRIEPIICAVVDLD
jgi:hypothetical protein